MLWPLSSWPAHGCPSLPGRRPGVQHWFLTTHALAQMIEDMAADNVVYAEIRTTPKVRRSFLATSS